MSDSYVLKRSLVLIDEDLVNFGKRLERLFFGNLAEDGMLLVKTVNFNVTKRYEEV